MSDAFRNPNLYLRFLQLVLGIVAFALVAEWASYSRYGYMVWCGTSTIVLTLAFMMLYFSSYEMPPVFELVVDAIWAIFWLVAAALMADELNNWPSPKPNRLKGSTALSWFTWFFFVCSVLVDFLSMRRGGGAPPTSAV